MIKAENLKKEYRNGEIVTKVLQEISFEIKQGEFVAIMGPSGSGKSTLMHILGFLDRATSGDYHFEGREITKLKDDELAFLRNEKVGFVFQSFNLLPRTTVLDNVKLPLTYSHSKKNVDEIAKKVLESVGLGHRLNYYTNQISGGEKQRVAIARALVNNPSVIFADEPTGNLDSKSGVEIVQILLDLNKNIGTTLIFVTHDPEIASHTKRVISLLDGLITEDRIVEK
ncbi:MAG: ABC transporter ATP-binding protein [Candidatus Omnitrophica bacterium]|nr:ABC transporter ATP-binding protein [Candidatus Omnitrophota bacterium]